MLNTSRIPEGKTRINLNTTLVNVKQFLQLHKDNFVGYLNTTLVNVKQKVQFY